MPIGHRYKYEPLIKDPDSLVPKFGGMMVTLFTVICNGWFAIDYPYLK